MSAERSLLRPRPQATKPHLVLLDKDNPPTSLNDKIRIINKLYVTGFITDLELEQSQQASALIRNVQKETQQQRPRKTDIRQNNDAQLFQAVKSAGYAFVELSGRVEALAEESERKITEEFLDSHRKKAVIAFFRNIGQPEELSKVSSDNLQQMVQDGQEALSLITEKNKGLVTKVASRIRRSSQFEWDDIMSAANIALVEAVVRYDPSRGPFSNYATQVIKGRILDEARKADSISRSTRQKAQQIQRTEDIFLQEQGRTPTIEELEEATGIQQKTITETRIIYSTRNDSIEDLFENTGMQPQQPDSNPLHQLLQNEDITEKNQMLNDAIRRLNPREQRVIALYYFESLTMKEISERLGVSESRICQLHAKVLEKIRYYNEYLSRRDNPVSIQTGETAALTITKSAEESILPEAQKPADGPGEKRVQYSQREQQFLDLYQNFQAVSKSQILQILREAMDRPPTSQDAQNFLQGVKKKLRQEGRELVKIVLVHSGEPLYRLGSLGSLDSLKPVRQETARPRLRSFGEEPDFEDIPETDDFLSFLPDIPDMTDYPGHATLFDRKRLPKQDPLRREYTPNVVYRKTVAPNGREMNLRPQEFIIYTAVMAGKSQREIIDESFDGDESKFFNYFPGVTAELNALGYNITSVLHHEGNDGTKTTYDITPKIKQELQHKKEAPAIKYIILTDADIENIVNPPVENRLLTPADVRVLAALIKVQSGMSISVDRLVQLISPNKISGFSEEVASLPSRIEFYNRVVFKDGPIKIRPKSGEDHDPGGYYVSLYSSLDLDQKIELLTRRVRQMEKTPKKQDGYVIQTQNGHNGSISLSVAKNGGKTEPVVLKDTVFEDNLSVKRHLGNDEAGSTVTYHLKASNQAKIFGLLFQNNPIATRIIRMRLADDKDGISQRELQLYIDALNGTLPEKDEKDGQGKPAGNNNSLSLKKLGLCITETSFKGDESITFAKYDPQTFSPVHLIGQYETINEELEKMDPRERRRKPSHAKLRL